MNREIKFRAWSKKTKEMIMDIQDMYDGIGTWFDNKGNEIDPYKGFRTDSFGGNLDDKNIVVMQYTGLKDKNGVEIYEGDIVKYNFWDTAEEVEYGFSTCECCGWCYGFSTKSQRVRFDNAFDCEVIGNKYENPDLLK